MSHMTDAMRAATANLAGDVEPHNDPLKSELIVRFAHGWTVDETGRLHGLVAGDQGYAATHIVLQPSDVDPTFAAACGPAATSVQRTHVSPSASAVRVKALEWDEHGRADVYSVSETYGQGPKPFVVVRGSRIIGSADTEEEGRQIAELDHQRRILSFVEPAPVQAGERVAMRFKVPAADFMDDTGEGWTYMHSVWVPRQSSRPHGAEPLYLHPSVATATCCEADAKGDMGSGDRTGGTPPTQDWTVEDSRTAGEILSFLGIGSDASLEPGADRRRDKVAAIICAAREVASHG